ncbi:MAG: sensor histidine kinase [Candidatus Sericytochromatia bacterium]
MFLVGIVNSIPESHINKGIEPHDNVILDTIGYSINFLSEIVPTDIHVYNLIENTVKTIFEAKPSFIKSFYKRTHIDYSFNIEKNDLFKKVIESKKTEKGVNGTIFNGLPLFQTLYPIKNKEDNVIGFLMVESSFDDSQKNTNLTNYFYFLIFESLINKLLSNAIFENTNLPKIKPSDGVLILDEMGIINYSNHIGINTLKRINSELLIEGNNFQEIFQDGVWKILQVNSLYYEQEVKIKELTINIKSIHIDNFILVILSDITEIRNKDQEIEIKSYIIKEIHHRVKNNLQSIVSLLRLQERRNKNQEVKDILSDNIQRITSIAIVHDYLSQKDVNSVDLSEMSKNIVNEISKTYSHPDKKINFKLNLPEKLFFPSSKAVSISLVLNEILNNILKHAFTEKDDGEVVLEIIESKTLKLIISDNGKGIPISFSPEKNGNLGWKIISNLVKEDLKGTYFLESNNPSGAKITIELSL